VSCSAPLGEGGLGRHCKELVDALARRGEPTTCLSGASGHERPARAGAGAGGLRSRLPSQSELLSALPIPVSPALRTRAFMVDYDRSAAARLPGGDRLIAFNGQAVAQFRAAHAAGYGSLTLLSANSHLRRVVAQHARAHRDYPLEGSWAKRLLQRNLAEYAQAERIYVASRYTRESFLAEGVAEDKLTLFPFTPDPRYEPADGAPASEYFEIVYIGSLTVAKGVPLLIDALARIPAADVRLRLIGGWASRGMRRFVQQACVRDPRITVSPGDPLPHLRAASLCVHPTYEDGFGYAPAEALACGVPVLVTEDTGMKDLIRSPADGLVLPTGDLDALTEAIASAHAGESFGARAMPRTS